MANSDSDIVPVVRPAKGGVLVKIGNNRLTVPTATILTGALVALGTAYEVVKRDRADIIARIDALEKADAVQRQKLEMQQLVLVEIRTQLARIDARVAEVQVTLMRGGRP